MDWIKQNKFLAGFLAVLLVASGALGFLVFTAKGKYEAAYADYQTKANELKTLQSEQPFPDGANVAKMQEVQKVHQTAIDTLQKDLIKAQIPAKPLTPEQFQNNLRESVRRVSAKIAEKKVTLEKKEEFYMGFEMYQGAPPKPEAATQLGQILEAMELAITTLIDSGVSEIKEVKRDFLPEEGLPTNQPQPNARDEKKDKKDDKETSLVKHHGLTLQFVIGEIQFKNFLNALISSKTQFFIPKSVSIANNAPTGPSKTGATPPGPGDPLVVGDEKLTVTTRVEIVNFAQPAPSK